MSTFGAIVEAMAADLNANVALGKHSTYTGAPRDMETPKNLPLLNVFPAKAEVLGLATEGSADLHHTVIVGWYSAVMEALDTGHVDNAAAKAHLDTADLLIARVLTWYAGVPGTLIGAQNEVRITEIRYGKVRGGVLGTEIHVDLRRWLGGTIG